MFKKIIIGILAVIAVFFVYAFFQPDTYVFYRSLNIQSPPQHVFNLVNDFHNWSQWFVPQYNNDLEASKRYKGNEKGKGSIYLMNDKSRNIEGRMEIIESDLPNRIIVRIDSTRPFKNHHEFEFTFKNENNLTNVTYLMRHTNTYLAKLIHSFVSVDTMFGKNFEDSLLNMKHIIEK
jgi:uncharacterized protein YndB with AHSA1/START domain